MGTNCAHCKDADCLQWLEGRPADIRKMVEAHPVCKIYRYTITGEVVRIRSYREDGLLSLDVCAEDNPMKRYKSRSGHIVDGVHPDDIAPLERH